MIQSCQAVATPYSFRSTTISLGQFSIGAVPDAAGNMWIAGWEFASLFRYQISSKNLTGTFSTLDNNLAMLALDGAGNIWACDSEAGVVNNLYVFTNGVLTATYSPSLSTVSSVLSIVYDGAGNMFVFAQRVGVNNSVVYKVRTSDGALLSTYSLGAVNISGAFPNIVLDTLTNSVWFCDFIGNLYKVSVATNTLTAMFAAGTYSVSPLQCVAYFGQSVWATDGAGNVFQINVANGVLQNTFTGFTSNISMAIDGSGNVWLLNYDSAVTGQTTISIILINGSVIGPYQIGVPVFEPPIYMVWDGVSSMWITSAGLTGSLNLYSTSFSAAVPVLLNPFASPQTTLPFCVSKPPCVAGMRFRDLV